MTPETSSRTLKGVGISVTAFSATNAMVNLFVPLAAIQQGASASMVGLLVSIAYALPFILAIPIGGISDRIGSRRLLLIAVATMSIVPVATGILLSIPTLVITQVLLGLAHVVFVIAAQRLVAGLGSGRLGERNFGWFSTFQSGAQLIGAVAAGLFLDLLGVHVAFAVAGGVALIALRSVLMLPQIMPRVQKIGSVSFAKSPYGEPGELKGMLANHGVRMAILVSASVLTVGAVRQSFLPVYLDALAYPATVIGILVSVRGFASMAVRPFMPSIVRILGGRSWTLLLTVLILAVGIGMTAFVKNFVPLFLASILVGVSTGISQPLSVVTVTDHVAAEKVGMALGFRLTGNRLAQLLAPVTVGVVAEMAGVRWSFLVVALVPLATVPFILLWRTAFERAEQRLAGSALESGG